MKPMFESLKGTQKGNLVGVEIGLGKGDNAFDILSSLNINKLYLIDPYLRYDEYKDPVWYLKSQQDLDGFCHRALTKLDGFKGKFEFIRQMSCDAVVPSNLDFVYVDGNHAYKYVKSDCDKYYKLLKIGGYLGGDNYEEDYKGVVRAVNEFVDGLGLHLYTELYTNHHTDWWIIKEE